MCLIGSSLFMHLHMLNSYTIEIDEILCYLTKHFMDFLFEPRRPLVKLSGPLAEFNFQSAQAGLNVINDNGCLIQYQYRFAIVDPEFNKIPFTDVLI